MDARYSLIAAVIVFFGAGAVFLWVHPAAPPAANGEVPVACTLEAKLCPDGSYVGRVGPHCDFAACPGTMNAAATSTSQGTVSGSITLSPTCPVEQNPPDTQCAPKGYQTIIEIRLTPDGKVIASTESDVNGNFSLALSPGTYTIDGASDKSGLPRCSPQTVEIEAGVAAHVSLSCDTGIR